MYASHFVADILQRHAEWVEYLTYFIHGNHSVDPCFGDIFPVCVCAPVDFVANERRFVHVCMRARAHGIHCIFTFTAGTPFSFTSNTYLSSSTNEEKRRGENGKYFGPVFGWAVQFIPSSEETFLRLSLPHSHIRHRMFAFVAAEKMLEHEMFLCLFNVHSELCVLCVSAPSLSFQWISPVLGCILWATRTFQANPH